MIRAIIVEDEKKASDLLSAIIQTYSSQDIVIIDTCTTCQAGIDSIIKHSPDLVFLDIEMPDNNGFHLLEQFPEPNFAVIFTTAFDQYAIRAFKFSAIDYLLKPIDEDEYCAAIEKYKQSNKKETKELLTNIISNHKQAKVTNQFKLALPTQNGFEFIITTDIIKLIAESNYTHVHTMTNKYLVTKTLKHFEEILDENVFCRIHHSHIVNLNCIKKYYKGRGGYVELTDGTNLEVSSRKLNDFKDKFDM